MKRAFAICLSETVSLDIAAFYNSYDHLQSLEPGVPLTECLAGTQTLIYPYISGNGVKDHFGNRDRPPIGNPAAWWRLQASYSLLHLDPQQGPPPEIWTPRRGVRFLRGSEPASPGPASVVLRSLPECGTQSDVSLRGRLAVLGVKGYETGDVRVAWRPVRHIEFAVVGQNLLQPRHAEYGGDPGALVGIKRSVYTSLTFRK